MRWLFTFTLGTILLFINQTLAATLSPGDLIKASGQAVYYYADDGKRYVFPTEKTYKSWYVDFSSVKTITDSELAAITIGGNVTYRPGVRLVKVTTDPHVYAVEGRELRWVTNEALAQSIFGDDWASQVDDLPDAFFVNYTIGPIIDDLTDYLPVAARSAYISIQETLPTPPLAPDPVRDAGPTVPPAPAPAPTSTTPSVSDSGAPTAPADLSANAVTDQSVFLAWTPSTDNAGVVGYVVFRNGLRVTNVDTTRFTDNGLTSGETYAYEVMAFDAAGNEGPRSMPKSVTMPIKQSRTSVATCPTMGLATYTIDSTDDVRTFTSFNSAGSPVSILYDLAVPATALQTSIQGGVFESGGAGTGLFIAFSNNNTTSTPVWELDARREYNTGTRQTFQNQISYTAGDRVQILLTDDGAGNQHVYFAGREIGTQSGSVSGAADGGTTYHVGWENGGFFSTNASGIGTYYRVAIFNQVVSSSDAALLASCDKSPSDVNGFQTLEDF